MANFNMHIRITTFSDVIKIPCFKLLEGIVKRQKEFSILLKFQIYLEKYFRVMQQKQKALSINFVKTLIHEQNNAMNSIIRIYFEFRQGATLVFG